MAALIPFITATVATAQAVTSGVQGAEQAKTARKQAKVAGKERERSSAQARRARTMQVGALAGGGSLAGSAGGKTLLGG